MSLSNLKTAKVLTVVLCLFLSASAQAAELDVKDGVVWLNEKKDDREEVTFSCQEQNAALKAGEKEFGNFSSSGALNNSNFDNSYGNNIKLNCYDNQGNLAKNVSKNLDIVGLDISQERDGVGFIGSVMGKDSYTSAVELELDSDDVEIGSLSVNDFDIPEESLKIEDIVVTGSDGKENVKLLIRVKEGFSPSKSSVDAIITVGSSEFETELNVNIYKWSAQLVGDSNPGPKMDYDDLGSLSYNLDIAYHGSDTSLKDTDLDNDNFRLTVKEKNKDGGYSDYQDYEDLKWFKWETPSNEGNYLVTLDNKPDLPPGKYKFVMEISQGGESFKVTELRVDKSTKFSGRIKDSTGQGVKTEMVLTTKSGRNIPVTTENNGIYSEEINEREYSSINLEFFDRRKDTYDSSLTVNNVNLGSSVDLASTSEAIGYQYWSDPPMSIEGLEPVNMMAIKFAHQINGQAQADMKFNPKNVDSEELKVFECNRWNFEGTQCMGEWTQVEDNKVSINLVSNTVNINNLNLRELPERVTGDNAKDVLTNAYIAGVNEKMELSSGLSFSGLEDGKAAVNQTLKASGRIISKSGEQIEDANVTVGIGDEVLMQGKTGSGGKFEVEGEAPPESGNYNVKINVSHETYQDFETSVSNDLEVFLKEEISIQIPENIDSEGFEITEGEKQEFEFEIRNTGQKELSSVAISQDSEMPEELVKLSENELGSLNPGESREIKLEVNLPDNYCDGLCTNYPVINLELDSQSRDGKSISDSYGVQTQVSSINQATETSEEPEETEANNSSNSFDFNTPSLAQGTGSFLASQTSLNLVLGLVMIFMMVLAGAVKKNKKDSLSRNRNTSLESHDMSRPSVHVPDVSAEEENRQGDELKEAIKDVKKKADEEGGEEIDEMAEKMKEETQQDEDAQEESMEETSDSSEDEGVMCSVCGEEFDTETARKLHEKAVHED